MVNMPNQAGVPLMAAVSTLPLIQDVGTTQSASALWNVTWRDVVVLNGENEFVGSFNLTGNNLSEQENYDELKTLLESALPEDAGN